MDIIATAQLLARETDSVAATIPDFESLLRLHRLRVFRFILASTRDKDIADTLTQDCFLKVYQSWARFRQECSIETWLMRIAVNLVRDHARNRRLRFWRRAVSATQTAEMFSEWLSDRKPSVETRIVHQEQLEAVWSAASRLPERQRTVFLLRFLEDMDLLEIATATGLREGTVKAHLFRALQTIREQMEVSR